MRRDRDSAESVTPTTPPTLSSENLACWMTRTCQGDAAALESWAGGSADVSVVTPSSEPSIFSPERMAEVRKAIDALPARARETYRLYYHRGLTYAQIAQAMGVSVRTVEAQLVRCVRRLTKELHDVLE